MQLADQQPRQCRAHTPTLPFHLLGIALRVPAPRPHCGPGGGHRGRRRGQVQERGGAAAGQGGGEQPAGGERLAGAHLRLAGPRPEGVRPADLSRLQGDSFHQHYHLLPIKGKLYI